MMARRAILLIAMLLAFAVCAVNIADCHGDCHDDDCANCGCQRGHVCTCALIAERCLVDAPSCDLTLLPEDSSFIPQDIPNSVFQPPKPAA